MYVLEQTTSTMPFRSFESGEIQAHFFFFNYHNQASSNIYNYNISSCLLEGHETKKNKAVFSHCFEISRDELG